MSDRAGQDLNVGASGKHLRATGTRGRDGSGHRGDAQYAKAA